MSRCRATDINPIEHQFVERTGDFCLLMASDVIGSLLLSLLPISGLSRLRGGPGLESGVNFSLDSLFDFELMSDICNYFDVVS